MAQSANNQESKPIKKRPKKKGRPPKVGGRRPGAGAPKGNTNAVKTGERRSVIFEALSAEDRAIFEAVNVEKRAQLEDEIRTLTMREVWMLRRIAELRSVDFTVVEISEEEGDDFSEKGGPHTKRVEKRLGTLGQIQAIEDALTRVQNSKAKAIELLIKLEADQPPSSGDTVKQFLAALDGKATQVWADEQADEEDEEQEAGE